MNLGSDPIPYYAVSDTASVSDTDYKQKRSINFNKKSKFTNAFVLCAAAHGDCRVHADKLLF